LILHALIKKAAPSEMPDQVRHDKASEMPEVRHDNTEKFRKIITFAAEETAYSFAIRSYGVY
jgi:hypothetical protein